LGQFKYAVGLHQPTVHFLYVSFITISSQVNKLTIWHFALLVSKGLHTMRSAVMDLAYIFTCDPQFIVSRLTAASTKFIVSLR